jgi:hypothetical protein
MSEINAPAATAAGFRDLRAEGDPPLRISLLAQRQRELE